MKRLVRKDFWSVIRVQQCDDKPGDRNGVWYCRIIRTGSKGFLDDILCDGTEPALRPLCDTLNNLMPRLLEIANAGIDRQEEAR